MKINQQTIEKENSKQKNKKSAEEKKSLLKKLLQEKKKEAEEEKKKLKELVREREEEKKAETFKEFEEEFEETEKGSEIEAKTEAIAPVLKPREIVLEEKLARVVIPEEEKEEKIKYEIVKGYKKGEEVYTPEAASRESRKYVEMKEILPMAESPARLLHKEFPTELKEEERVEKKYKTVKEEREFPFRMEEEKRKYRK